ncbi:MAG: sigma-54-dependent Fis family transcriptional regulator [Nitrospirae bacterium]|nr:sigma-54-dependent Fis family transcriptional regulator [Nitrospirota bacterium]
MDTRVKVLVIDDEADMLDNCSRIIRRLGYDCVTLQDGRKAAAFIEREMPYVILTDFAMPGINGIDVLKLAKEIDPDTTIILISGFATIPSVVEAMKEGAFDYLAKPFSADQLRVAVERAVKHRGLSEENRFLRSQLAQSQGFDNMLGTSLPMRQVFDTIKKVSVTDTNVLVYGESGTGKELVARSIHANSKRARKPFVPVDCASLPENLLESELFGHEKGTFTGADSTRPGLLEFANGGTFFLDEIGEMGINLQAKLLRVLQERQFRRVGGRKMLDIDIRVIAATNRDLEEGIRKGTFREDLYYRLNVISITLPPLRERIGDVPLLANHFLQEYSSSSPNAAYGITPDAMRMLEDYSWPGNVRELQNVISRATALSTGGVTGPDDLPEHIRETRGAPVGGIKSGLSFKDAKKRWLATFEKEYLADLLKKHDNNISRAAVEAGIDRKTIHRLLNKYKLGE